MNVLKYTYINVKCSLEQVGKARMYLVFCKHERKLYFTSVLFQRTPSNWKRYGGKAVCLINSLLKPKTSLNLQNCQFLQVKVKLILLLLSFDYALHPCFSNLPKQTLHKCPLSGTKIETRVAPFLLRRLILRGAKFQLSQELTAPSFYL